jgi:hypothetical protein
MGIAGHAGPVAVIVIAIISCTASAQEKRNCDPKAGLVDGSCYIPRTVPWWKCEDETRLTSPERGVNPEQRQRIEQLSLTLFASRIPDYGPGAPKSSRSDLISRFGPPVSTKSEEVPNDPRDPSDTARLIRTTWEYRGLQIITFGELASPDQFWVDEGEISDGRVPLPYGLRIGQSISRWKRQLGQPNCIQGRPTYESHFGDGEDNWSFNPPLYQVVLFVDDAGTVRRIRWDHPPRH